MLHAKFNDHRNISSGRLFKVFTIYGRGGHGGYIHVYSPGAGEDKPLGSNIFHSHINSVSLVLCCK